MLISSRVKYKSKIKFKRIFNIYFIILLCFAKIKNIPNSQIVVQNKKAKNFFYSYKYRKLPLAHLKNSIFAKNFFICSQGIFPGVLQFRCFENDICDLIFFF